MKQKKVSKKLNLRKITVNLLSPEQLNWINGGVDTLGTPCMYSNYTCPDATCRTCYC